MLDTRGSRARVFIFFSFGSYSHRFLLVFCKMVEAGEVEGKCKVIVRVRPLLQGEPEDAESVAVDSEKNTIQVKESPLEFHHHRDHPEN